MRAVRPALAWCVELPGTLQCGSVLAVAVFINTAVVPPRLFAPGTKVLVVFSIVYSPPSQLKIISSHYTYHNSSPSSVGSSSPQGAWSSLRPALSYNVLSLAHAAPSALSRTRVPSAPFRAFIPAASAVLLSKALQPAATLLHTWLESCAP